MHAHVCAAVRVYLNKRIHAQTHAQEYTHVHMYCIYKHKCYMYCTQCPHQTHRHMYIHLHKYICMHAADTHMIMHEHACMH